MTGPALRFVLIGAAVAIVAAGVALPLALGRGPGVVAWALAGWLVMALVGAGGGAWLVATHGSAVFVPALGVCILTRLVALVSGSFLAATQGKAAVGAYLAGLLVGYVPTQIFEVVWFVNGAGVLHAPGHDSR